MHALAQVCSDKKDNTTHPLFTLPGGGASMVTIEDIAHKIRLLDEREAQRSKASENPETCCVPCIDGLTADLSDKAKFIGGEDKAKFIEKQADKMTLPMFEGEKGVWAASLTDNGLEIFQELDKVRSEHDLESLELRWPETKDLKS